MPGFACHSSASSSRLSFLSKASGWQGVRVHLSPKKTIVNQIFKIMQKKKKNPLEMGNRLGKTLCFVVLFMCFLCSGYFRILIFDSLYNADK